MTHLPIKKTRVAQALALSALLGLAACSPSHKASSSAVAAEAPAPAASLTVKLTSPQNEVLPTVVAASGSIHAWQEAAVDAEVGGLRVVQLMADVGDQVSRGQVLARLADDTVRADLAQALGALAEAKAAQAQAKANASRARTLMAAQATSEQDLLQATTQESSATARVQAAQAQVDAQQLRLARTRIVAPDAGTLTSRAASVGQVVSSGAPLFRLVRQDRLDWRAQLPAQALLQVKPGQRAQLTLPDGTLASGKVRVVSPDLDENTRSGIAYIALDPGTAAKPGMFVSGQLHLGEAPARTVPGAALVVRDGVSYLMQVDSANRVHALKVRTGRRDAQRVEITEGLPSQGEVNIVAQGAGFLNDGDAVRVVDADVAAVDGEKGVTQ